MSIEKTAKNKIQFKEETLEKWHDIINSELGELLAHKESMDLWEWLWQNYPNKKEDYPEFNIIIKYKNHCSLCDYYDVECYKCCLINCSQLDSNYGIWRHRRIRDELTLSHSLVGIWAAREIYLTIRNKYEELKNNVVSE